MLVLVVIMALLETAGVASILPFLAVLGNPELVETNPMLAYLYNTLGFQDVQRFLLALGVTAFAVVILAAGCRILTTYAMNRFVQMRGHSLAERLLETYLRQPYTFFLDRHSGDLAKGVLSEVYLVLANVLRPGFYIIAYSLVALAIVLVLTLFLMADTGAGVGAVLPILGLYAFAGLKLLPAVQQIYAGASHLRFGAAAVDNLFADLRQREQLAEIARNVPGCRRRGATSHCMTFPTLIPAQRRPRCGVSTWSFPPVPRSDWSGGTGAGKTTLVDLILGLLRPTEGALSVDGVPITETNLRAWQQGLGYVPQSIFLTDSTIAENIALGVPRAQIDPENVERCARLAQVHDFIVGELPDQYDTTVGDRGIRLSGGQRQRIGIARALYHDPRSGGIGLRRSRAGSSPWNFPICCG